MEVFLDQEQIAGLEKLERAALINSITGFKNANLIGTIDNEGKTNLAIFNSVIHLGANPALMGFIVRPDAVERHTLKNIEETGYYTINHVNDKIYKQAHQTSARYPSEISEFDACGLMPVFKNNFPSPYVSESSITIGLSFEERVDIKLNGTILVIGKIMQLHFPEDCLCTDGFVDIEKASTIACTGLDSYHLTKRLSRLQYAKQDKNLLELEIKYKI
jgi:flavin reductase (DIM6/NTAB) family NADH-FMN oxidoreductase RutF